jgi:acyl carrier protein
MNEDAFLEKLADILEVNKDDLNEEFPLLGDNWNSLAIVSTIAVIDEQFGTTVPIEELKDCASVRALVQLVHRNLT